MSQSQTDWKDKYSHSHHAELGLAKHDTVVIYIYYIGLHVGASQDVESFFFHNHNWPQCL